MTKEEFDLWAEEMYEKLNNEKRLSYSINSAKGICVVYTTDTYESAVSKYDKDKVSIAIATAYAKLKGIEIPTIEETPTPWRAELHETYYYIHSTCSVDDDVETRTNYYHDVIDHSDEHYKFGNYFKTREQAESACKKIKYLLKLQRLHDMLCPDNNGEDSEKYCVFYDTEVHEYVIGCWHCRQSDSDVYFTNEAAEKACEILNKEKEND